LHHEFRGSRNRIWSAKVILTRRSLPNVAFVTAHHADVGNLKRLTNTGASSSHASGFWPAATATQGRDE
jgi:hypothetical protein